MKFPTKITSAVAAFALANCGTHTYEDTRPRDKYGDPIENFKYDSSGNLESYDKYVDGRKVTYIEYRGEFRRLGELGIIVQLVTAMLNVAVNAVILLIILITAYLLI